MSRFSLILNHSLFCFIFLQTIIRESFLNSNATCSWIKDISMRVERGLKEGSLRFTPPNPQPTLNEPSMNPLYT